MQQHESVDRQHAVTPPSPWYPPHQSASSTPAYHARPHSQSSSIAPYPPSISGQADAIYPPSPSGNNFRPRYEVIPPPGLAPGISDARISHPDGPAAYGSSHQSSMDPWNTSPAHNDRPSGDASPRESRYHDGYDAREQPMSADPYRSSYASGPNSYPAMHNHASSSSVGEIGLSSAHHTPTSNNPGHFSSDPYGAGHHAPARGGPSSSSSRELMSPGLDGLDDGHISNFASFGKDVGAAHGMGEDDGDNRTRNAKAQKRHREKRKAFVKHLETSTAVLQNEIRRLNIALLERGGPPAGPRCPGGPGCPSNETHAAVLAENRALLDQLSMVRSENEDLRKYLARNSGAPINYPSAKGLGGAETGENSRAVVDGVTGYPAPAPPDFGREDEQHNDERSFDPAVVPRTNLEPEQDQHGSRPFANNYLPPPSSLTAPGPLHASTSSQYIADSKISGSVR